MRPSTRRSDDADVIRARLRALLDEGRRPGGWVPDEVPEDDAEAAEEDVGEPDEDGDPDHWETSVADDPAGPVVGRHRAPGRTARVAPDRPTAWALWAAALAAVLLVLGWTWLHRPDVQPAPAGAAEPSTTAAADHAASATPAPARTAAATSGAPSGAVVVSVVGEVARPGLVTLAPGARVADALAAVGGLLPDADPAGVNAAAVLTDGQQIPVGVPGAAAAGQAAATSAATGPVDLNTATVADLDALPGVGPVLAQRIVDHRTEHGPFTSVEQLDDVSGIGPALYAQLAPRVRV